MMGIDERALRVVWTVFLFGLLLAVCYFIRYTLLVFALAIFFAYMLSPVVDLVERFLPRGRSYALAFVYVVLVGVLVLIGFELIPALGSEATNFGNHLPKMLARTKLATIPLPSWLEPLRDQVVSIVTREASSLSSRVVPFVQELGTRILTGLSDVIPLILIPILAFFFLKDGEQIRINLLGAVDKARDRSLLDQILEDIHLVLKSYIRALVLLAIASFICWVIFLSAMGYPYELLLAGVAGLLEFIPVIGPAAAGIVMLIVYGVSGTGSLLWIVIFWGAYRVFADYVLNPYLMSAGVELHPLLVLFGVLAGEGIAGIPGMFFSVPVIAILRVLYLNLRSDYHRRKVEPTARTPATQEILTPSPGEPALK
jgi:predicted PurR-regulated permease PerM